MKVSSTAFIAVGAHSLSVTVARETFDNTYELRFSTGREIVVQAAPLSQPGMVNDVILKSLVGPEIHRIAEELPGALRATIDQGQPAASDELTPTEKERKAHEDAVARYNELISGDRAIRYDGIKDCHILMLPKRREQVIDWLVAHPEVGREP